jgi:metal-responsive CopG/Arc/MetJ family transcriptional regulator
MKRKKTKDNITISLDRTLNNIVDDIIANRSKYVEWLIYQDILKNSKDDRIKEVII